MDADGAIITSSTAGAAAAAETEQRPLCSRPIGRRTVAADFWDRLLLTAKQPGNKIMLEGVSSRDFQKKAPPSS